MFFLSIKVNFITVVIFNLFQTIASAIYSLTINKAEIDVSNHKDIKNNFKIEYFLGMERNTFLGRLLGYVIYIVFGLLDIHFINNIVLFIFAIIIILLMNNCIKLINNILEGNSVESI